MQTSSQGRLNGLNGLHHNQLGFQTFLAKKAALSGDEEGHRRRTSCGQANPNASQLVGATGGESLSVRPDERNHQKQEPDLCWLFHRFFSPLPFSCSEYRPIKGTLSI